MRLSLPQPVRWSARAVAVLTTLGVLAACSSGGHSVHESMTSSQSPMPGASDDSMHMTGATAAQGLSEQLDGYTLDPGAKTAERGKDLTYAFHITQADGRPLTDYAIENAKKLHLIVVRKDLTGYQHVHPVLAADGTWSVHLTFAEPGPYRIYADFLPAAMMSSETTVVLGTDLTVAGAYTPQALPAASDSAMVDGYSVTRSGDVAAGADSQLTFRVTKDGKNVTTLQPYLGSLGHLVSIRAKDLGYTHTHPIAASNSGPDVMFHVSFAEAGNYRQFFQFQTNGVVHAVAFTLTAT